MKIGFIYTLAHPITKIISSLRKTIPERGLGKGYWYSVRVELLKKKNNE